MAQSLINQKCPLYGPIQMLTHNAGGGVSEVGSVSQPPNRNKEGIGA
jgi:hypothetical protein